MNNADISDVYKCVNCGKILGATPYVKQQEHDIFCIECFNKEDWSKEE